MNILQKTSLVGFILAKSKDKTVAILVYFSTILDFEKRIELQFIGLLFKKP